MTENPTPYFSEKDKLLALNEARAVAYVATLAADDRPAQADKLNAAALMMPCWLGAVARVLNDSPAVDLPALWAMLNRPGLDDDRRTLDAVGVDLEGLRNTDPQELARAFGDVLADTAAAQEQSRVMSAQGMLKQFLAGDSDKSLLLDAVHELTRAQAAADKPLAQAWEEHLQLMAANEAGPDEVLRLDAERGGLSSWMNSLLGPRGGLEAGETFILGGAPEAGKTSLAALFAVDALNAGCPVTFWQLELSREGTLEHLLAQRPQPSDWWKTPFWDRVRGQPLPAAWEDLLTLPRWPSHNAEDIEAALFNMARRTERDRKRGERRHKVNGLLVVDYAQLLTVADKTARESRFELLERAASRLAKATAESGACLLLLSQMNKEAQKDGTAAGTALAGADLARMAHRVALLQKAADDGTACKAGMPPWWDRVNGERRLLTFTKARGVRYVGGQRPDPGTNFYVNNQSRAIHWGN